MAEERSVTGEGAETAHRRADWHLLDEGVIRVRGGALFDRDESFRIFAHDDGFTIHSDIESDQARFRFRCRFEYDRTWLPLSACAEGQNGDEHVSVTISTHGGGAQLEVKGPDSATTRQRLSLPTDGLVDLEPSTMPMWAMTRRYDRAARGGQQFEWAGRSLTRGLVLEGGKTDLHLRTSDASGEHFEFTEVLPGPDGAPYRVEFKLENDDNGWLQSFAIKAGTTRVTARRLPAGEHRQPHPAEQG